MKHYETQDFSLATTLQTMGFVLEFLNRENPNRVGFCFKQTDELNKIVELFWKDEIVLNPRIFYPNQKIIKSRLYNDK